MKGNYKSLSVFLRISLEIVFYSGFVVTMLLPFFLYKYPNIVYRYFWFYLGNRSARFVATIILIEIFGISALIIVRQLVLIFKSVNDDNPFTQINVRRLKSIAVSCFVVFAAFFLKCIFFFTLITFVLTVAFLIAGLAAFVFGELFYQAVGFKSENDMTI